MYFNKQNKKGLIMRSIQITDLEKIKILVRYERYLRFCEEQLNSKLETLIHVDSDEYWSVSYDLHFIRGEISAVGRIALFI